MNEAILAVSLLLLAGMAALGIYLVLPVHDGPVAREVRWAGAAAAGLATFLLGVLVAPRAEWWPESRLDRLAPAVGFYALAGASLVAAGFVVASRRAIHAARGFALMLLAVAGLLAYLEAPLPAAVLVIGVAGALVLAWRFPAKLDAVRLTSPGVEGQREPLLACAAAALLAATLIGVVQFALVAEANPDRGERGPAVVPPPDRVKSADLSLRNGPAAHDYHLLNNSLVVGALLFGLGVIGFACRREVVAIILSAGVMLQGVVLTLVAFGGFHGEGPVRAFSLAVLLSALVEGAAALAIVGSPVRREDSSGRVAP